MVQHGNRTSRHELPLRCAPCQRQRRAGGRLCRRVRLSGVVLLLALATGCGTSNWSDTTRTATEQLLITDAIDRAINQIDFEVLAGKEVFFDAQYLKGAVDANYLESSLRQHLLASGCILKEKREDATYVVEARAGAVGTDRNQILFGVPAVNLPTAFIPGSPVGVPSQLPEIALAKDTNQKAVSKIAVFAYNRVTGNPVWQSGIARSKADAKNTWVLGAGPFQRGSIYDGTNFAGGDLPGIGNEEREEGLRPDIPITAEAIFPYFDDQEETELVDDEPGDSAGANQPARISRLPAIVEDESEENAPAP